MKVRRESLKLIQSCGSSSYNEGTHMYGCRMGYCKFSLSASCVYTLCVFHDFLISALCALVHNYIPVVTGAPVSSDSIVPTATSSSLTLRPSTSAETAGERISWYTTNLA